MWLVTIVILIFYLILIQIKGKGQHIQIYEQIQINEQHKN